MTYTTALLSWDVYQFSSLTGRDRVREGEGGFRFELPPLPEPVAKPQPLQIPLPEAIPCLPDLLAGATGALIFEVAV